MIWRRCMIYPFWGWWYKIISVLLLIYYWFWAVTDSSSALDSSSMVWWLISGWCICSLYSILIKSSNYYIHNILDIYDYAYILVTQQHFNISLAVKRSYKEIISSSSLGCLQARSSSLLSFGCYRSLAWAITCPCSRLGLDQYPLFSSQSHRRLSRRRFYRFWGCFVRDRLLLAIPLETMDRRNHRWIHRIFLPSIDSCKDWNVWTSIFLNQGHRKISRMYSYWLYSAISIMWSYLWKNYSWCSFSVLLDLEAAILEGKCVAVGLHDSRKYLFLFKVIFVASIHKAIFLPRMPMEITI